MSNIYKNMNEEQKRDILNDFKKIYNNEEMSSFNITFYNDTYVIKINNNYV